MDDDKRITRLEETLDELLELAEENNKILIKMERAARWSFWGRLLIWILVLALPFIVLAPFLHALVPGLSGMEGKGLFGLPSGEQTKALFEAYKSGSTTLGQ